MRQRTSINAIAVAVVVAIWCHFKAVKVTCDDGLASTDSIVVGCVYTALVAVLDHHIWSRPDRHTELPAREVVF